MSKLLLNLASSEQGDVCGHDWCSFWYPLIHFNSRETLIIQSLIKISSTFIRQFVRKRPFSSILELWQWVVNDMSGIHIASSLSDSQYAIRVIIRCLIRRQRPWMSSSTAETIETTGTISSSPRTKSRHKTSHNSQVSNGFDYLFFVFSL